ncbi:MAG TPA: DEAD/DEAH box helicase [Spirochaetes bacterium]|nr:DEAD/DEAH box helicase [Spirochaetota bacterium]
MEKRTQAISLFHPVIRDWFTEKYGLPTDAQEKSWPLIADGKHVLLTAPTGSGKTLAAFLWGLNQLVSGAWHTGTVRVLYVSPLKALNNDIRENLLVPLGEIKESFLKKRLVFPGIHVLTRSGDTPGAERQRMIRKPPEILITTPESLNLLLSSKKALHIFTGIRTVILDEIHAVVAGKRGAHLISAVDRLVRYAGDFQRIALSATVKPVERVAEYVGGFRFEVEDGKYLYQKREVRIVQSDDMERFRIAVRFPENAHDSVMEGSRQLLWPKAS